MLYVTDPANADKINWSFGENVMKHLMENILPSIQSLNLSAEEVAKVNAPVLTIHGTRDRQALYGCGRECVLMLPNARLVTIENAAHIYPGWRLLEKSSAQSRLSLTARGQRRHTEWSH